MVKFQERPEPNSAGNYVIRNSLASFMATEVRKAVDCGAAQCMNYDSPSYATGKTWDLGVSGKIAAEKAMTGDPELVQGYENMVKDVEESYTGDRACWVPSFAGTRVSVPDYLGGNPMAMRQRKRVQGSGRHVNIYVSLVTFCGCQAKDMLTRGQAVMGLLSTLQAMGVSVDVFLLAEWGDDNYFDKTGKIYSQLIQLETRPLDLSVSGFAIAHPAFARNVVYSTLYMYNLPRSGPFPPVAAKNGPESKAYEEDIRKRYNLQPTDIVSLSAGWDSLVIKNPKQWVLEHTRQALGIEG